MTTNKKYKLIDEPGTTLKRLVALRDFGDIKEGDKGGLLASEDNLSHEWDCWVYENARVYGGAQVYGNAQVYENAQVHGNARVSGNSILRTGSITRSDQIIHMTGLQYNITATPTHCVIGCRLFTWDEVLKITKKEASKMGLDEEQYVYYKGILKVIYKKLGGKK